MRKFAIEMGGLYSLEIETAASDEEMDGTFTATCLDTGETLRINGWLIDSQEEI